MIESESVNSPEEMFGFTEDEMKYIGSEVASVLGGNAIRAANVVRFAMFMTLRNRERGEGKK